MKSFARGHRTRMWRSWATVPNSAKPGSANPGPLSPLHLIVKPCQLPSIQGMARRGGRLNTQGLVEVLSGLGYPRREQHSCALGSSALDSPNPLPNPPQLATCHQSKQSSCGPGGPLPRGGPKTGKGKPTQAGNPQWLFCWDLQQIPQPTYTRPPKWSSPLHA